MSGWWIDGCFRRPCGFTETSLKPFHDAVKAGNPKALVGFNDGVHHHIGRFSRPSGKTSAAVPAVGDSDNGAAEAGGTMKAKK